MSDPSSVIDIFPTLHFLARPGLTPALLTVTRSGSGATCINALGQVAEVNANALRHDFDAASGHYLGWLVEESRANLALHSRDLSQAAWNRTQMTASRSVLGLDGASASACLLTATAATATVFQPLSATSATYTLSVDLKRQTGSGPVSLTLDGGATWTPVTAALDAAGSAFTRLTLTQTLANPTPGLRISTSGDAVVCDYWQVEAGSFATSRLATTTAPVTRAADRLTVATTGGGWFNRLEGTVYVEATPRSPGTAPRNLFSSAQDPKSVEFSVDTPANGVQTNTGYIASGYSGTTASGHAVSLGTPQRVALAYGLGGGACAHNGNTFLTYATGSSWDTSQVAFGHQIRGGAQRFLNGHIRHVAIFPRRLSNAQIEGLTLP